MLHPADYYYLFHFSRATSGGFSFFRVDGWHNTATNDRLLVCVPSVYTLNSHHPILSLRAFRTEYLDIHDKYAEIAFQLIHECCIHSHLSRAGPCETNHGHLAKGNNPAFHRNFRIRRTLGYDHLSCRHARIVRTISHPPFLNQPLFSLFGGFKYSSKHGILSLVAGGPCATIIHPAKWQPLYAPFHSAVLFGSKFRLARSQNAGSTQLMQAFKTGPTATTINLAQCCQLYAPFHTSPAFGLKKTSF